jgi:ADP-heptose:LPS heptosyltransferase
VTVPARRICVLARLWEPGLGDLIQRNILLHLLARAYPGAEITHVVGAATAVRFADFFAAHSYASRVIGCPDYGDDDPREWDPLLRKLGDDRYDLCLVDPDSRGLTARHAELAGIPARFGYATGGDDDRHLTVPIRLPRPIFGQPDLFDYAHGLARCLGVELTRPADAVPPFPYRRDDVPTHPAPVVALHPGGARHWNRRWPLASYVELCRHLAESTAGTFLLVGGADEQEDLDAVRGDITAAAPRWQVAVSCGESLNRLANRLGGVDVLVGSDSAPAHLAAALGRPTVVLYGPTATEFFWTRVYPRHHGINRRYECQTVRNLPRGPGTTTMPCRFACHYPYVSAAGPYPRCLSDISVAEVFQAVRRQLAAHAEAERASR